MYVLRTMCQYAFVFSTVCAFDFYLVKDRSIFVVFSKEWMCGVVMLESRY
jgi:hypothetical protein